MCAFRLNNLSLFIVTILILGSSNNAQSQQKCWINFTDKDIENYDYSKFLTSEAIQNRIRNKCELNQYSDMPLNQLYIDSITSYNVSILQKSRWFNAVSANITISQRKKILELEFVDNITEMGPPLVPLGIEEINHSMVLKQLGASDFERNALTGEGVSVGIIDAGFTDADSSDNFSHIFKRNGVKGVKDFLNPGRSDFFESVTRADYHGRKVWKLIAGYNDTTQSKYGLGTGANFYLARTEDGLKEYRVEEDAWLAAIEWMDSLGVRLVSTSLGYTNSFDDIKDNYKTSEMDGKTSVVARAAEMAVTEKGMFVVISAGNEGNIEWGTLSTPADAKSALAVGACGYKSYKKAGYSSYGPEFTTFVKPDIVCYSLNGTSYSAPSIAGFVACLIQLKPEITNKELMSVIHRSANLNPFPNNYVGYGVPSAYKAINLIKEGITERENNCMVHVRGKEWLYTFEYDPILTPICFHKKDEFHVFKQRELDIEKRKSKNKESSKADRRKLRLERRRLKREGKYVAKKYSIIRVEKELGAKRTTVFTGSNVFEIIWDR